MRLPILLFATDPVAARTLATQLRHAGLVIYLTFDGSEAIAKARGGRYASTVVIADLADSQMRHYLHEIRDADPDLWLLVISDPSLDNASEVVRGLGGDATMCVPFTVSDLVQRLSVLPNRARPLA
jgi:DNA-binding response OmpR family regulator